MFMGLAHDCGGEGPLTSVDIEERGPGVKVGQTL